MHGKGHIDFVVKLQSQPLLPALMPGLEAESSIADESVRPDLHSDSQCQRQILLWPQMGSAADCLSAKMILWQQRFFGCWKWLHNTIHTNPLNRLICYSNECFRNCCQFSLWRNKVCILNEVWYCTPVWFWSISVVVVVHVPCLHTASIAKNRPWICPEMCWNEIS